MPVTGTGKISRSLVFATMATLSTTVFSHSPMFDDYFKFDDSNGGASVTPEILTQLEEGSQVACVNGLAGGVYPCEKIDLQSFLPKADMGGSAANLNDIWGWTDPMTGAEIAIVGLEDGTSFVDITDPVNPVYLGKLDAHDDGFDSWRDMKVYDDHAFIVADGGGNSTHGLQVFDLGQLRDVVNPPVAFAETAHLGSFGNAHNIAINEDTGFAYVVGSNQCSGGLFMVDVSNPANPANAGCFSSDGYTHDTQCVVYAGPDSRYTGKEICFGYNEDTITIVDVTSKTNPVQISRTPYSGAQYTHQGWLLDENQAIAIMNDELDEANSGVNTTSYVFDVADLRNPKLLGRYFGPSSSIDHNLYTKDGYVFEANYRSGLRIISTDDIDSGRMREEAFFDVIPDSDSAQFSGAWSSYVYFESGNIVVSDIGGGLFVVSPDWDAIRDPGDGVADISVSADVSVDEGSVAATVTVNLSATSTETVNVTVFTQQGTANRRVDYYGLSRTLSFAPGETSKNVSVVLVDDDVEEPSESFIVRIAEAENANIVDDRATITIMDDDGAPVMNVSSVTVDESAGSATVTVSLSRAATSVVSAKVHSRADSAVGGVDYFGFTEDVSFAVGETSATVTMTILDDATAESEERFFVLMAQVQNAAPGTSGVVTISDDD